MFAASYVTGSHSFKTGMDLNGATRWADTSSVVPYSYVVSTLANNGVGDGHPGADYALPALRRMHGSAPSPGQWWSGRREHVDPACTVRRRRRTRSASEGGIYVQDKWTIDRVTLSMGVRYDWFNSENPQYHLGPSILTPNRNYDVPDVRHDPLQGLHAQSRGGVGRLRRRQRRRIKVNYGKYVLGQALVVGGLASQPGYNVQLTSSRSWIDNNSDFVPDCDLTRNTNQGPTQVGIDRQVDTCNAATAANANFYSNTLIPNLAVQDDARYGWGKRPYSWEFSVSGQHEVEPGRLR